MQTQRVTFGPLLLAASALLLLLLASPVAGTSLIYYNSCPRLLSFYHVNAIKRASEFAQAPIRRRALGGPGIAPTFAAPEAAAPQAAPASSDSAHAAPIAGTDFSDTNVQVDGVDEPDIVKTDGVRVFAVRGRRLSFVRTSSGGSAGKVVSTLEFKTSVREMMIEKDTLLIIGSDFGNLDPSIKPTPVPRPPFFPGRPVPRPIPQPLPEPVSIAARQQASARLSILPVFGQSITVVYRVSIIGDKLVLKDTLRMHGNYVSAREVSGVVRLVTTFSPRVFYPWSVPLLRGATAPPEAASAIRRTTLTSWLPRYRLTAPCDRKTQRWCRRPRTGYVVQCNRVYHPRGSFSGFSLLTVTTLRMRGWLLPRGSSAVVSNGRNVYATEKSLYVATTVYQNDFFSAGPQIIGASFRTSFHKFQLQPWGSAYVGSGSVLGSVLNQFSMHEFKDVFYIATTLGAPWWRGRDESSSRVTSFRQDTRSRTLPQLGYVGNLGVGERIFAVRYVQALAYVVTFRQIDPLYVVDIKNPMRMKVTGELKIPGFSSYLHPLGNGKLLGVGREVENNRATGAKVSLFDVSDVTNPRELAVWTLKGSYSQARWDHRAFLYWAPERAAVLPLNVFSRNANERFAGSIILRVDNNKIVEEGRISHPKCCGKFASTPSIERNFVLGRKYIWSLSRSFLQANDINSREVKAVVKLVDQ